MTCFRLMVGICWPCLCLFHLCICLSLMSVCFCFMSHLLLPLLPSQLVIECLQLAHDLPQHSSCLLVCLFVCLFHLCICLSIYLFAFISCLTFFSPSFLASWSLSACSLPMISLSTRLACLFFFFVFFCLFVCFICVSVCQYICLLLFHVSPSSPPRSFLASWSLSACSLPMISLSTRLACLFVCLFVCLSVSFVYLSVNISVCFYFMSHLLLPLLPGQLVIECLQLAHDLPQHSSCLLVCLFVCLSVSFVYLSVNISVCFYFMSHLLLPLFPGQLVIAACPWSPSALLLLACLFVCFFVCFTSVSVCLYVCLLLFHVSPSSPPPS